MSIKAKWLNIVGLLVAVFMVAMPAHAEGNLLKRWQPTDVFVQAGLAEHDTQTYVLGAMWRWQWQYPLFKGVLTGYSDASVGRWSTYAGSGSAAWVTQVGITPVLRWSPGANSHWFAEIGIGANFILPIYHTEDKTFSTDFNFGDHFAVGRRLGERNQHEIALRIEHFSNGGIDEPNPGENFVQLRYAVRI